MVEMETVETIKNKNMLTAATREITEVKNTHTHTHRQVQRSVCEVGTSSSEFNSVSRL